MTAQHKRRETGHTCLRQDNSEGVVQPEAVAPSSLSYLSHSPKCWSQGFSPIQLPAWKPLSQSWFPRKPKTVCKYYMSIHTPFFIVSASKSCFLFRIYREFENDDEIIEHLPVSGSMRTKTLHASYFIWRSQQPFKIGPIITQLDKLWTWS